MRMRKLRNFIHIPGRSHIAAAMAVVMLLGGLAVQGVYASSAIETEKKCTLTVNVPIGDTYAEDIKKAEINVKVYKLASVAANGTYTSANAFKTCDFESVSNGNEKWDEKLSAAEKIVDDNSLAPDQTLTLKDGTGTLSDLSVGLYLVKVDETTSESYTYKFNSYIVSLPDNLYYHKDSSGNPSGADEWIYDVTSTLKPEATPRYGELKIIKSLDNFNEALGKVTFVFEVEGTKDGKVVYSNVASITFENGGSNETVLDHIPVGAEITVKEVYSGASYKATSDTVKNPGTISADKMLETTFTNTYDDKLNPSYGVGNHFDYDENDGWQWTKQ